MAEAREFEMPAQIRNLFATLLVFEEITNENLLQEENYTSMAEDLTQKNVYTEDHKIQLVLRELNKILQRHDKTVANYNLPKLLPETKFESTQKIILEELNYNITPRNLPESIY